MNDVPKASFGSTVRAKRWWPAVSDTWNQAAEAISQIKLFDLIAALTAYALFRVSHTPVDMTLTVLTSLLMLKRSLRNHPLFWLAITASWIPRFFINTYYYEDHVYLVVYWCAALGLARWGQDCKGVLQKSARLLIGFTFGIAFLWKLVSVEFYDGSLFHFKLMYDYRFGEMVTQPIGGLSNASNTLNYESYRSMREFDQDQTAFPVAIPQRVSWIAQAMTSWTILIEGAIAALFLLPATSFTNRWRDISLLLFLMTTYIVAPVLGFASIFAAMGVAQLGDERHGTKLAYLVTLGALTAWYTVRWHVL